MRDALDKVERFFLRWGSRPISRRTLFVAAGCIIVFLYLRPQAPGYAVGALAVGAIVMTFWEMTATHKAIAAVFAISLIFLEYRSISQDRQSAENNQQSNLRQILKDNRDKTNAILHNSNLEFAATERNFSNVIGDEKRATQLGASNLSTAVETLNRVTGGNSVVYIAPRVSSDNHLNLAIWNNGPYRVSDVSISIRSLDYPQKGGQLSASVPSVLGRTWGDFVPSYEETFVKEPEKKLWFLIALSGALESEVLEFRPGIKRRWSYRLVVERVALPTLAETESDPSYHAGVILRVPWTEIGPTK